MDNRFRRTKIITAVIMVITMVLPQSVVYAKNVDKPVATSVNYYTDNGKKTGIESFSIDPYYYYNIGRDEAINPKGADTIVLNTSKMHDIAAREIFPKWSVIAEGIFRDKADQLVTIEGTGMMSSDKSADNSFDRQFNFRKKGVNEDYTKYAWSIGDLAGMIARTTSRHDGKICWDEMRATGITSISSLADARRLMGQELRNCADDDDNTVDDFLANKKDKTDNEYRLPDLDDKKSGSGFASIVTCVNRAGASADYDYVSFGLAVYDFDVSPVAATDLAYITAADKTEDGKAMVDGLRGDVPWKNATGISYKDTHKNPSTKIFSNSSPNESEAESNLETSTTIENSLSTEETFEWGMTQHIGVEIAIGETSASFARATVEASNEWSEVWSTMKGSSETHGDSKTKSASQTINLPPHTAVTLKENAATTTVKERYQQPVIINYKVAIFAMSGDYFNGWCGGISPSRYDKQWLSVIFDGSDQEKKSGNNALGSLYNRAVTNRNVQGYDGANGKLNSWCDKGAWHKNRHIAWADIEKEITDDYETRATHNIKSRRTGNKSTLTDMAKDIPMIEQAVIMNTNKEVMVSELSQKIPLYTLKSVDVTDKTKKRYQMKSGDTLYLDGVALTGYNNDGIEFFGFDSSCGHWQLLDKNKKPIEDGSEADQDQEPGQVTSGNFTLVTDDMLEIQYVEAGEQNETSSVYLHWVIDPEAKLSSNEILTAYENNTRSTNIMTPEELAQVNTPSIQIYTRKSAESTIEAKGSYEGSVKNQINLNQVLNVTAKVDKDNPDEEAHIPLYWEAEDKPGINVDESGACSFNNAGDYRVRAYYYNYKDPGVFAAEEPEAGAEADADKVYSEWLTVTAKDPSVLTSVKFDEEKLEELSKNLIIDKDHPTVNLNLNDCIIYLDQYGEKMEPLSYDEDTSTWSDLVDDIEFILGDVDGALIRESGEFEASKPAEYTISGKVWTDPDSDTSIEIPEAKIVVGGENYLSAVVFDDYAFAPYDVMSLVDKNDEVVIDDLSSMILYYDQDGNPWTGQKPKVTFTVENGGLFTDDYEVVDNNKLIIRKPTCINLWLEADGGFYDHVEISVAEGFDTDPDNLLINVKEPGEVKLDESGQPTDIDIERMLDYETLIGGKWEGKIPELSFSLDAGETKAKLETHKEIISSETEEGAEEYSEYTAFVTKEPGTYRIHITVKDPQEYPNKIDDLVIKVKASSEGDSEKKDDTKPSDNSGKQNDTKPANNSGNKAAAKKNQTLKIKTAAKKISFKKLAKKKKTVAPIKVKGAKGKLSFKKISVTSKKYKKQFTVNKKTGKITVKKGTKKGNYKIKVKVSAAGTKDYAAASKKVTVKIKVK